MGAGRPREDPDRPSAFSDFSRQSVSDFPDLSRSTRNEEDDKKQQGSEYCAGQTF